MSIESFSKDVEKFGEGFAEGFVDGINQVGKAYQEAFSQIASWFKHSSALAQKSSPQLELYQDDTEKYTVRNVEHTEPVVNVMELV